MQWGAPRTSDGGLSAVLQQSSLIYLTSGTFVYQVGETNPPTESPSRVSSLLQYTLSEQLARQEQLASERWIPLS